jgi:sulfite dehydrogenase (quinone) subunit SoeC
MGYVIARKHAAKLRWISLAIGLIAPAILLIAGLLVGGLAGQALAGAAALAALLGVYIERWLFFAEATHTVTLYYGQRHETARLKTA